jgi:uncharacterized tellurite resistance protein B-like protein
MGILDFLGWGKADAPRASSAETDTVRKIAAELERLPPDRARHLAAFAYLLGRVAHADMEISADETREMERIVRETGELPEEQAVLVVHMAKTQAMLFGGVENYLVTREFDRIATREQKIALLHCLFAVSAADHSVSSVEDATIRKIASELRLEHADFIAVKTAYRDHLAVLKQPPSGPSTS